MTTFLLALGSNLGERSRCLRRALHALERSGTCHVARVSRFHETAPWGHVEQPRFLNAVACCVTHRAPEEVLQRIQLQESRQGRVRTVRNGPRTLDLDLLLFGSCRWHSADLDLPHPRMLERSFVMEPALEVAAHWVHPDVGVSLAEAWSWQQRGHGETSPCV